MVCSTIYVTLSDPERFDGGTLNIIGRAAAVGLLAARLAASFPASSAISANA